VGPSDAEVAAVVAAATELLSRRRETATVDDVPRWRFSGRWFSAHPYSELRRP
jgi:hypothetical protein